MESKPRSNVGDLMPVSGFLTTVAAAFVTVIELNLQSSYLSSNLWSGEITLWRAGLLDIFVISFEMVLCGVHEVNSKRAAYFAF